MEERTTVTQLTRAQFISFQDLFYSCVFVFDKNSSSV